MPRHFLTGAELTPDELGTLLDRAAELKREPLSSRALEGRSVALIFEKPSTRTRLSFEAGVAELGGHPLVLRSGELQLSRGESVRDTALVLSRHVAVACVRTGPDALLEELAENASIPVVNMLTAGHHPCQALADLLTLREAFGSLEGLRVAYVGDGNNVARSLAVLGALAGMEVVVAAPAGYQLEAVADAILTDDPAEAVAGARAVYTDVWVSMGDEDTASTRRAALWACQSTTPCSGARRATRSLCTASPPPLARRSRSRCSTAHASASGTRRRTAATPRRRCSSGSSAPPEPQLAGSSARRRPGRAGAIALARGPRVLEESFMPQPKSGGARRGTSSARAKSSTSKRSSAAKSGGRKPAAKKASPASRKTASSAKRKPAARKAAARKASSTASRKPAAKRSGGRRPANRSPRPGTWCARTSTPFATPSRAASSRP